MTYVLRDKIPKEVKIMAKKKSKKKAKKKKK